MEDKTKDTPQADINIAGFEELKKKPTFWQRLKLRLVRWWLFTVRNETIWEGEIKGFRYRFRKQWLDIKSIDPNHWDLRIGVGCYAYGLLLTVVGELQKAQLEGKVELIEYYENYFSFFATQIYQTSNYLFSDEKFCKALGKELNWAFNRLIKKAEESAKAVTKEQEDSEQVFMEQSIERGNMNRQQRRKASRAEKKAMKAEAEELLKDLE